MATHDTGAGGRLGHRVAELLLPDLAGALAERAGHPVHVEPVDDDTMAAHLTSAGLTADRARLVATWHRAVREGWFAQRTDVVEALTGRPARPLAALLAAAP